VKVYYSLIENDLTTRDRFLEASIFDFLPHHQLALLNDHRAWVTLHVPKVDRLGHPDNLHEIREIRRRYPNPTPVIAHLGRCYTMPHAEQALPRLADDEDLYFDLSAVFNPDVLRLAIELFGPSRLLYGTDNPVFYMRGRQRWRAATYVNHTDYPFFFNREREPREIESRYTLYVYEALRAIKQACEDLALNRSQVEAIFSGNAQTLIQRIASAATWGS
jgi:predicted TIM-barrel fold metal-dependent hydrolase